MNPRLCCERLAPGFHRKPGAPPFIGSVWVALLLIVAACRGGLGAVWSEVTQRAPWTARDGHTCVVLHGKLWILGGCEAGGQTFRNDVWNSLDGSAWTEVFPAARWPRRAEHTAVTFADSIWLLGGANLRVRVSYNDVWRLRIGP